eukprot:TRINITY_DN31399_c0_g1_i1.p1 TRINITY_DN31399_c0_g1~~TRINITY_DN31399_c0_g1_i1.p1  ORF type:complete len:636 (-),score=111.11 TRINITY_DN31399_c0_g1_i1:119-1783(-)
MEAVTTEFDEDQVYVATVLKEIDSRGNATCHAVSSCCQGSEHTQRQIIWDALKSWGEQWHIRELLDSTPRMLERYYTFYNLYYEMRARKVGLLWARDCYFGVVSMLLNAVPAMEYEEGIESARELFSQAVMMLEHNNGTHIVNWTIPREPLVTTFPFYLGMRSNTCHGSKLRIFVYDTGEFSSGSVFCSAGQWGVEVMLHRYFAHSTCRTDDPDEADLFLVPDYRACHYHLAPKYHHEGLTRLSGDDYHSAIIRNHAKKYRVFEEADLIFRRLVKSLKYFDRRRGLDHMFIFSDQGFVVNFTHTFPSWREEIPNSIFLTTEAFTPGCGASCFSPWKDIVIPGHIDWDRLKDIKSRNRPSEERTLLFNFHGRVPDNHDYYASNKVRKAIVDLAMNPNISVGGFVEDYFDIMGNSHFCLVPVGTSSWTNHLYTSFFAGCIPVILSDNFVLPFEDLIDWPSVSIRWPEEHVNIGLYVYILDLVQNRRELVEEMKRQVDANACWFDFYAFDDACSPYRAVLHSMEKRARDMPKKYLQPATWGPRMYRDPNDGTPMMRA